MQLFYTPEIQGEFCMLNEEESKHSHRVLRLKQGDPISITDGQGNLYDAIIDDPDPRSTRIKIIHVHREYQKRSFRIHIGMAPTKNIDRFEWFLEKATEIGIDEITPVITAHSERTHINTARLERIIIAAMKQSLKAYKPRINELQVFKNFIRLDKSAQQKFIAHCNMPNLNTLKDTYTPGMDAIVLIGPEGDFSTDEVAAAEKFSYQSISLGKSRLRTETAGLVACHTMNLLNT